MIAIAIFLADQHHTHQEGEAQADNAEEDTDLPNRLWTIISTLQVTRAFARSSCRIHTFTLLL